MRRAVVLLLPVAVIAIVVVGLSQASGGRSDPKPARRFDIDRALTQLRGAPAPLAALHRRHGQLLGGGVNAFEARLRALRGHPVVINKWASWCYPCRQEAPILQRASAEFGRRVAFLGIDGKDNVREARAFLREFPVPYPSYRDDDEDIARKLGIPVNYPITLFLGADGRQTFVHQGAYRTYAALRDDIRRYLRA